MPGRAAKIIITERQQEVLQTMTRSSTCPQAVAQRARMILLGFDGLDNEDIADRIGCERHGVGIWRRRWAEEGTHTVSVDEMTGIQALERIAATKPMRPGQEERREFEYKRHGTQCLIGNFEVATGAVITPTVQATRTEQDFAVHIAATVATDPETGWIFVADNLTIHCSESLVRYVAQECGIADDLGKK